MPMPSTHNPFSLSKDGIYIADDDDSISEKKVELKEINDHVTVSTSVMIIWFVVFVGDASRGMLFPLLWSLCEHLHGTMVDLGYLVAIYSFGRILVTTPLGYLSDRYQHRYPLALASFVLCLGSLLWANAILTSNIYTLYFAQFIMGCGSGSLGVTRSYIVEQTLPEFRTSTLAILNALQYAGFTVSPVFGSILGSNIGKRIDDYWMYAFPSYCLCLLSLLCLLLLLFVFKNIPETSTRNILDGSVLAVISSAMSPISSPRFIRSHSQSHQQSSYSPYAQLDSPTQHRLQSVQQQNQQVSNMRSPYNINLYSSDNPLHALSYVPTSLSSSSSLSRYANSNVGSALHTTLLSAPSPVLLRPASSSNQHQSYMNIINYDNSNRLSSLSPPTSSSSKPRSQDEFLLTTAASTTTTVTPIIHRTNYNSNDVFLNSGHNDYNRDNTNYSDDYSSGISMRQRNQQQQQQWSLNPPVSSISKPSSSSSSSKPSSSSSSFKQPTAQQSNHIFSSYDRNGILMLIIICTMILLNVATKGSISVYETLGAQIGITRYKLNMNEIGVLVTISGFIGFLQLLSFKAFWTFYFNDIQLVCMGLIVMILAQFVAIFNLIQLNLVSYIISIVFVYAFGFPVAHTALLGAYSKLQKTGPQGTLLGLFATAGSVARICMPIISVYLEKLGGMDIPFCFVLAVLALSYVSIVLLGPVLETLILTDNSGSSNSNKILVIDSDNNNTNSNNNKRTRNTTSIAKTVDQYKDDDDGYDDDDEEVGKYTAGNNGSNNNSNNGSSNSKSINKIGPMSPLLTDDEPHNGDSHAQMNTHTDDDLPLHLVAEPEVPPQLRSLTVYEKFQVTIMSAVFLLSVALIIVISLGLVH